MATAEIVSRPTVRQTECFIDGQWIPAQSGKTFDTIHPASGEVIAAVAEGDEADVENGEVKNNFGTINLMVVTNALPHLTGRVEGHHIASMAKTQALLESGEKSKKSGRPATGTGTDCIVVASCGEVKENYCGMHTVPGELIGKTVFKTISGF